MRPQRMVRICDHCESLWVVSPPSLVLYSYIYIYIYIMTTNANLACSCYSWPDPPFCLSILEASWAMQVLLQREAPLRHFRNETLLEAAEATRHLELNVWPNPGFPWGRWKGQRAAFAGFAGADAFGAQNKLTIGNKLRGLSWLR